MMNINSNRAMSNAEIYGLLQKLGVIKNVDSNKEKEFIELFSNFGGTFGNPVDKQSMNNLFRLLINLGVDISNENNHNIIFMAIYNKKDSKISDSSNEKIEKQDYLSIFTSIDKKEATDKDLENYVKILMYELGFKPSLAGFNLFKDGVLYLLEKRKEYLFSKGVYSFLSQKHNIKLISVERTLRHLVTIGFSNHFDNEVSRYVYGDKTHVKISECLCSLAVYIVQKDSYLRLKGKSLKDYQNNNNVSVKSEDENTRLEKLIDNVIKDLCVSANTNGYYYLKDAIYYLLERQDFVPWMALYSDIAKRYSTTRISVERSLGFIIEMGYKKTPNNKVSQYVYGGKMHLSISEFLALIVEYIKHYQYKNVNENSEEIIDVDMKLEKMVKLVIHDLGISSNIRGYYYLNEAILYTLKNNDYLSWSGLYSTVALVYSTTYSRVERAIRHVVSKCNEKYGNMTRKELYSSEATDVVKFIYSYSSDFNNSEFIALVADYIRLTDKEQLLLNYSIPKNSKMAKKLVKENDK